MESVTHLNNASLKRKISVCVIGAGAAGLCATRHLLEKSDRFDFDVFEKTGAIGGTWNYTEKVGLDENGEPIHTSMYKNLRTNLPMEIMQFLDFPAKSGKTSFPGHLEVKQYLHDYADAYGLENHIKFYHRIEKLKRAEQWLVSVRNLRTNNMFERCYDAVLVCNGRYSVPKIPDIDTKESNLKIIHSHDYRVPEVYKSENVVVLGAGPSGLDIALEISQFANKVFLIHEKSKNFKGFPDNVHQINSTIAKVEGCSVSLKNGRVIDDVTTLLYATGYEFDYGFMDETCKLVVTPIGRVQNLYLHFINIHEPTMAVLGVNFNVIPFPLFQQQIRLFLKLLLKEVTLPSTDEMLRAELDDFQRHLALGLPERHVHKKPGNLQWELLDSISELGQLDKVPLYVRLAHEEMQTFRETDVAGFRDYKLNVINESEYEFIKKSPCVNKQ